MKKVISDRYMLVSSLGEGGMADVYLAVDTILNREVAIKILRGELSKDPVTLLRFQREASAVSKLHHPNVVDVYDVGEYEGRHYIVMEYVRGRTLKQLISQRGALPQEEAVDIMKQLTSAVQHAHERNIIHRDIKPQNVLVTDDGTVKITDFGIALAHDAVQLTQADAVLGSAHYLAPETTKGETINNQVDIYALGIVFYELLRGTVPFKGENPVQIAMKHLHEEMPSIREFNPTVWQSVENIILRATVKNRKYRYTSAKAMLIDLEHCLDTQKRHEEKVEFPCDKQPTVTMKNQHLQKEREAARQARLIEIEDTEPKKSKTLFIAGGIIVLLLVVVLGGYFILHHSDPDRVVTIPEVEDMTYEEALAALEKVGFTDATIEIKESWSDDEGKDAVLSITPKSDTKVKLSDGVILEISKGTYYVVEDYTNRSFAEVEKELKEKVPGLRLDVEYQQTTELKPGYVVGQSISEGDKLEPDGEYDMHLLVTQSVSFRIEGLVGKSVAEAKESLEEKGIMPVLHAMSMPEDDADAKPDVVMKVDPQEGTLYTQEGDNVITLYYYEES